MWMLPNGKIIKNPSVGKFFTIDEVNHPEQNLLYWDDETLAKVGVKRFVETKFDTNLYRSTGFVDVEFDGIVTRSYTTELKPVIPKTSEQLIDEKIIELKIAEDEARKDLAITELKAEEIIPIDYIKKV